MLQVFGVTSFIHDHTFKKDFFEREITGYHLGIAEDFKGLLFCIPGKKRITRSESVKFDENTFYNSKHHNVQSIQVYDLFKESMINKINHQDKLITAIFKETYQAIMLPTTYHEAINSRDKDQWIEAIEDGLSSMKEENVFKMVELKKELAEVLHESILSTKWVFVKKPGRYKARLVA
ncbi:hypothetical protein O181_020941 [Austropuccinia psidii MF-1]|uniref:Retroviral polymerase SH3-like domain-containing protein n=1 Tax=Austropuccinia psidii MF-1 TaxID=1389203 RepID=A0A9Q3GVA3_9BASI|nr:hypothetical protein [Austropuccinia psidii MF-1]